MSSDLQPALEANAAKMDRLAEQVSEATSPKSTPAESSSRSLTSVLFNRSKPKSSKSKAKKKKAELSEKVENAKSQELKLISTEIALDEPSHGDEQQVLDLADQLLAQLDANDDSNSNDTVPQLSSETPTNRPAQRSSSTVSKSSGGSGKLRELKEDLKERFSGSPKVSRQQQRKMKKQAQEDALRAEAAAEVENGGPDLGQKEAEDLDRACKAMNLRMELIQPDGHCLFSAVADQLNHTQLAPGADYTVTRKAAAGYMRQHKDDFLPFLMEDDSEGYLDDERYQQYCDLIENTAEWGGQCEISALSKHYKAPIFVLQANLPLLKVGVDEFAKQKPLMISYHRRQYGLGEHYNSLRPASDMGQRIAIAA